MITMGHLQGCSRGVDRVRSSLTAGSLCRFMRHSFLTNARTPRRHKSSRELHYSPGLFPFLNFYGLAGTAFVARRFGVVTDQGDEKGRFVGSCDSRLRVRSN